MLRNISIRNLAVVEDVEVSFTNRMNVITGETGSGKSLLIDAIKLILGSRADKSLIRAGEKECSILAEFAFNEEFNINKLLAEMDLPTCHDNSLIIKRTISSSTSRNQVNNEPVTLQSLKKVGEIIVDMHGPYDHQSLLDSKKQLNILDSFGCSKNTLSKYQKLYSEYIELSKIEKNLENESSDGIDQEIEFLEYQINEINKAELTIEEEKKIIIEHDISANAHQVLIHSAEITQILNSDEDCAYDKLAASQNILNKLGGLISESEKWSDQINEAVNIILDVTSEIERFVGSIDASSQRLDWLDERLTTYQSLKRKYKCSVEEILHKKEKWVEKLEYLKNIGQNIVLIRKKKKEKYNELLDLGKILSDQRESSADNLSGLITKELVDLGFEHAFFDINLISVDPYKMGLDEISFGFSPNTGEDMRDLKLIASSGEMSRVMLAVKNVLSKQDNIPILVFDEIDANIGGEIANAVGAKLKKISEKHQVICITHLPQVASQESNHIHVSKSVIDGRTFSTMKVLNKDNRPLEIARMLSGDEKSDISIKHAKSLLKEN